MENIAELMEKPDATVAVVGATDDPSKYGSVIYRDLKHKGFRVYPINPNRPTVDGDFTFASLSDLPIPPSIVNIVVPPEIALNILRQCLELGWMNVWLQPGAESAESLAFLQQHSFNYLANACIMVQSRLKV